MGSLVSGIAGLIEGDPTKPEENQLESLTGFEAPTGQNATKAATDYYGGILSGDSSQIAMTLAPEISTATQSAEQQKLSNAEFGNRSGGTNASNQSIDDKTRGNIINLIGSERANAAGAEAGIGENLLGQAGTNTMNQAQLAEQARQNQLSQIGGIASGVGQIVSGLPFGSSAPTTENLNPARIADAGPAPYVDPGEYAALSGPNPMNAMAPPPMPDVETGDIWSTSSSPTLY